MQLLICVLNKTECLEDILRKFGENGIFGATILTSKGMAHYLNETDELPFMDSIFRLLNPENSESKTFFMVISDEKLKIASRIINEVTGGLDLPDTGILFTLPVNYTEGISRKNCNE